MSGFESPGGTSSVTRMVGWVLGSLLLSMFLVSGKLVEIAERQPLGDSRDRWIDVAEGVDRASNFLAMNRPYDLITDIRGVGTDAGEQVDTIEEVAAALGREREPSQTPGPAPTIAVRPRPTATAPQVATPEAPTATGAPLDSGATGDAEPTPALDAVEEPEPTGTPDDAGAVASPGPAEDLETAEVVPDPQPAQIDFEDASVPRWLVPPVGPWFLPPPKIRTVTPEDPLRVYVAGDSLSYYPGNALATGADRELLDVTVDFRNSTGLARPDFFNWPAEFLEIAANDDPELVVIFMGGNDWQAMESPEGAILRRGTDEWLSEWAWRMQITFDALAAPHRHVVWVGLPPARSDPFRDGYQQINELSWLVTLTRSDVTMVDIWDVFGGDDPFQESVSPPSGGDPVRVRQEDGIHLNHTGARWVAEMVSEIAADRWELAAE